MDDQQNQTSQATVNKKTDNYKCPSCGGDMAFDPQSQVLKCPFCGTSSQVAVEASAIRDSDIDTAAESANINWGALKRVFHCNNCGAESILDGTSTAQFCAFCGSSHIVKYEDAAGIAPEGLIPFKVTKSVAEENFSSWIKKRFFAPGALKSNYRNQSVSGAYIPFWAISAETNSSYTAEAGSYYYVTESKPVQKDGKTEMVDQQVRKINWRRVSGSFSQSFRNLLVNASKQIKNSIISRIEPFRLDELVPYASGFLAGFLAEKYSVVLKEGWEEAKKRIDRDIESGVKTQIGADEVRNLSINTSYSNKRYKHLLLPVWISSYTFNKKIYHFMVNGQTGKVSGESPVSAGKVILTIAIIVAVIALLVMLIR